jgi:hypothetical protein
MATATDLQAAVAAEITRYGSLADAITALAYDACGAAWDSPIHDIYRAAVAERSRQRQATETLDERCFRLGLMASDKDAEAERHMAGAADAAGRAAGRRARWGNDEYARSFDREEWACTKLAVDAMAEAERLRSQAAALRKASGAGAVTIPTLEPITATVRQLDPAIWGDAAASLQQKVA